MPSKGQKISEVHKKRLSLANTKNRKCMVKGCNNKHEGLGFCKNHLAKHHRDTNPELKAKHNKKNLERYYKNHDENKLRKNIKGKSERAELYRKLGAKCVSCGEKYNPKLARSNLEIHHKEYSKEDLEVKTKFKGNIGSRHISELKKMFKNGVNPNKKFCLLCQQCNLLEAFVRMNPVKGFEMFCWLSSENYFDEALKDDPTLKKITDFLK